VLVQFIGILCGIVAALRRNNSCIESAKKVDQSFLDQRNFPGRMSDPLNLPQQSDSSAAIGDNENMNSNCNKHQGTVVSQPNGLLTPLGASPLKVQSSTCLGYVPARPPNRSPDHMVVNMNGYPHGMVAGTQVMPAGLRPLPTYRHQNVSYGMPVVGNMQNGFNPFYQCNQLPSNVAYTEVYHQRQTFVPLVRHHSYRPVAFLPVQSLQQTGAIHSTLPHPVYVFPAQSSQPSAAVQSTLPNPAHASPTSSIVSKASLSNSTTDTTSIVAMLADAMIDDSNVMNAYSTDTIGHLDPLCASNSNQIVGLDSRTVMATSNCESDGSLSDWSIVSPESPDTRSDSSQSSVGNDSTAVHSLEKDESSVLLMTFSSPPLNSSIRSTGQLTVLIIMSVADGSVYV